LSREQFLNYVEGAGEPREIYSDVGRATRERLVWPLISIPRGLIILYPEFLVFLTDDERSAARRIVSFSVTGLAARLVPYVDRLGQLAQGLGLKSFDRAKALANPQSFFIPRRDIKSARPFWKATHGGIVHVRTGDAHDFYLYQDMHSTGTWRYFAGGGWRWQKRLAEAITRALNSNTETTL
jgi:hypothetical protein